VTESIVIKKSLAWINTWLQWDRCC